MIFSWKTSKTLLGGRGSCWESASAFSGGDRDGNPHKLISASQNTQKLLSKTNGNQNSMRNPIWSRCWCWT